MLTWVNWLVLVQGTLGALTVLTVRSPLVASLHVLVGAVLFAATLLCLLRCLPLPDVSAASAPPAAVVRPPPPRRGTVRGAL